MVVTPNGNRSTLNAPDREQPLAAAFVQENLITHHRSRFFSFSLNLFASTHSFALSDLMQRTCASSRKSYTNFSIAGKLLAALPERFTLSLFRCVPRQASLYLVATSASVQSGKSIAFPLWPTHVDKAANALSSFSMLLLIRIMQFKQAF
ncbi:hypothetical protein SELMODRAFT_421202 [Selaginella moellendorffii]|uniref:Uncharacterized protein n=1 Tax=Selaginella moellendorffii TaxID=88036 RepID=D8SEC2_SELML|nr:hypothetical protein SELMODRAFT_421202 [Selaginella moellendorffii]